MISPDRRALICGLVLVAGSARAAGCASRRVLFVCPAGTVKSAIAREMLKRRAASRGVPLSVTSRGVHPEDHVTPALARRLAADGIDPAAEPARALTPEDLGRADIVIAFDEAAQAPGLTRARIWETPSWNGDYDRAMADVSRRVETLIDELAATSCPPTTPGD